jgi:hypothetical protein
MTMTDNDNSYFSFGNFPMAPLRLNALRSVLAVDLSLLENLNLASITTSQLLNVIKSAATAKIMHTALSQSVLPALRETAFRCSGALSWNDVIAYMLERHPECATVNLDLGLNAYPQASKPNPHLHMSVSDFSVRNIREA